ncbi:MAG: cytochrome c oxidase subunit 3 family protein [Acidobacteriota bacterium]
MIGSETEPPAPDAAVHPPHLAHHFSSPQQQFESGKLGMWVFLATEILFFSGLFCAYAVYRANHPDIFVYAHHFLDKILGGVNTLVLICSSLTMAWAVRCAQLSRRRGLIALLSLTLCFAFCFLGIKFVEYDHKWKHGLLWGKHFQPQESAGEPGSAAKTRESRQKADKQEAAIGPATPAPAGAAPAGSRDERSQIPPAAIGPRGLARTHPTQSIEKTPPKNVQVFFGIYFMMTGLHALHVIAGMIMLGWLLARSVRGDFSSAYFTPVDLGGLYWHLVDLIWIYLFPLLYLIH